MKNIIIMSKIMKVFSFLVSIAMSLSSLLFILYVMSTSEGSAIIQIDIPLTLPLVDKMILLIPFSVAVLFAICISYFAYRFFHFVSQGAVFTAQNIKLLKRVSALYFIGNVVYFLSFIGIFSFFPTLRKTEELKVQLQLHAIAIPLFILFVAWILDEGRKLKEREFYFPESM